MTAPADRRRGLRRLPHAMLGRDQPLRAERLERLRLHLPAPVLVRERREGDVRLRLAVVLAIGVVPPRPDVRAVVERRLYRLLVPAGERLHPLELERAPHLDPAVGHEPSRHDDVRLRGVVLLKLVLQIAAGLLLAIAVLFVLTIAIHQIRAH